MLERTSAGKYAKAVFFEKFNDFNVYIEDTAPGYPKIFARLLSRAMSNNITLERVYPLGGRKNVIEAAILELSSPAPKKSVYIVDGDLFLMLGESDPIPDNVIVLDRYCIENFILDEESILNLLDEEDYTRGAEELKENFDYKGWKDDSIEGFRRLFTIYALSHKHKLGIPTVSRGHKSICANERGDIDPKKIQEIYDEIYAELSNKIGVDSTEEEVASITKSLDTSQCFIDKYVSAKDYSLPLLILRVRRLTESKAMNINIKSRFSMHCSIEPLREVIFKMSKILGMPEILPQE